MPELPEFQYEHITVMHSNFCHWLFPSDLGLPLGLTCRGQDCYAVLRYGLSFFYPPAYGTLVQAEPDFETYRVPTFNSVLRYYEGVLGSKLSGGNFHIKVSNSFAYSTCKPIRYRITGCIDTMWSCYPIVNCFYSWEKCEQHIDPASGMFLCGPVHTEPAPFCRGPCDEGQALFDFDMDNFSLTFLNEKYNIAYSKIKKNGCRDSHCYLCSRIPEDADQTSPTKDVTVYEHRFRPFLIKPKTTEESKSCCCSGTCKKIEIDEDTWKFEGNFDKYGVCTSDICVLTPMDGVVPVGAYSLVYPQKYFGFVKIHSAIPINNSGDYYEFWFSAIGRGARVGPGFGKLNFNISDLIISDPLFFLYDGHEYISRVSIEFLVGPATSLIDIKSIDPTSPMSPTFRTSIFAEANKFPYMKGRTVVSENIEFRRFDLPLNIHLPDNIAEKLLVVEDHAVYTDHDIGKVPLRQIIVFRNSGRPIYLQVFPEDDNYNPISINLFGSVDAGKCSKYVYWRDINLYGTNKKLNTLKINYHDTFPDFPEKDLFPAQIPGEIVPFMRSLSFSDISGFTYGMIHENIMYKIQGDLFTSEPLPDKFGPIYSFESSIRSIPVVVDIPNVDFDPIPKHLAYIDGVAFRKYE